MVPFLRWAGGKRWLAKIISPIIKNRLNKTNGVYFEPFLGSGAMFFAIEPSKNILSDMNLELIKTYKTLRISWRKIQSIMMQWDVNKSNYYLIRSLETTNRYEAAARFIWLNRTCYGGLYRENKSGEFNVPYGGGSRTPELLFKANILRKTSKILKQDAKIIHSDFEKIIDMAQEGDVVYCDPTYTNVQRGQFDRYGSNIFSWDDQIRLAYSAEKAWNRGVSVIVSNGFFNDLIPLYPKAYRLPQKKIKAIGNKATSSENGYEYLLVLDPYKNRKTWKKIGYIENRCLSKKKVLREV